MRHISFCIILGTLIPVIPGSAVFAKVTQPCITCHEDQNTDLDTSRHANLLCTSCHPDIKNYPHPEKVQTVKCQDCHAAENVKYQKSIHGLAIKDNIPEAARCASCHGDSGHTIYGKDDPRSAVYHLNLPRTCGKCHSNPEMAQKYGIPVENAYQLYMDSIHGRAVMKSGLLMAANCSDCHGTHDIQPHTVASSHINRKHIPETCGKCHVGVLATYKKSIHGTLFEAGIEEAPVCTDCHKGHQISTTEKDPWKLAIIKNCGNCHEKAFESYRHSYHGKVSSLGYTRIARCSDCHGSHNILPPSAPESTLSEKNIVGTCKQCHPGASASFTEYQPHADYTDKKNYPTLYYVYVGFTALLVGTFALSWTHSILWLIRGLIEKRKKGGK